MKTLVLVNPASGGGRAQTVESSVAEYLRQQGLSADFVSSQNAQDLRRSAAQAASAGYETIAALGGDGTFLHVLNGAFGGDAILAILPAGNANDLANALDIPRDPVAAARLLLGGLPRRLDVVRARFGDGHTELYAGVGGMGLDAEAARLASGRFHALPGVARYLAGAFWAFANFQPLALEAEFDEERFSGSVLFAAVANAPAYGAGIKIAPAAAMDDGWLEVALVSPVAWTRVLEAIPVILQTGNVRLPELRRLRARRIRLRTDRSALFHGDGEVLGATPIELEVIPKAIQVMVATGSHG